MLRGKGLDVIDVQDTSKSWLRYARHFVGIAVIFLGSPDVVLFGRGVAGWVGLIFAVALWSFAVVGLYALFFTQRAKRHWPSSLFKVMWITAVLYMVGAWSSLSGTTSTVTSTPAASHQPRPEPAERTPESNPFSNPDFGKNLTPQQPANTAQSQNNSQSTEAHYQAIYRAHPDADAVANSAQFQHWLNMYPAYRTVLDNGTTQQIIEMFTAFKMQRQQTFDPATARPVTQ